jgi:SAM-dependent methyltransferase
MEAELQRRVQRYGWDRASELYEGFWDKQLRPAQDLLLEMADIRGGEQILDIACGTGLVSFRALEKTGTTGSVLGTDLSGKMIELASQAAPEKSGGSIAFERMDAEALLLPEDRFDTVLCALGLMYMPDPRQALREMFRVLKKGGRAVAAVWGKRDHCGWADIFEIVDRRVSSEVCPMFFNLGNPGMLPMSFQSAGFKRVSTSTIFTTLYFESGEQACGAAFAGGPVALAYHKFSEEVKKEVHAEYLASLGQYRSGDGFAVPGEYVVSIGFK